jgi:aspartate/glutamate racemase
MIPVTTDSVILGCTELSMLAKKFRMARSDIYFADPLEIASRYIIHNYIPISVVSETS